MSQSRPTATISQATTADDIAAVRRLFTAYGESLNFSLCFQGFDEELAGLPGAYDPAQRGALLLARLDGVPAGVVGLRALEPGIAEMKRLFVDPAGRGHNLGRLLAEAVMDAAREYGYHTMRLDSVRSMVAANRIYDALGFRDIPPYYDSPVPDTRYREVKL